MWRVESLPWGWGWRTDHERSPWEDTFEMGIEK